MEPKTDNGLKIHSDLSFFTISDFSFKLATRACLFGGTIWGIHNLFHFTLFESSIIGLASFFVFKAFDINQTLEKGLGTIQNKIEGMMLFYEDEEDLGVAFREHLEMLLLKDKTSEAVRLYRNVLQCDMQMARKFISDLEHNIEIEENLR